MLVAQEFYYITTGNYRTRKSVTVYYLISENGTAKAVKALYPEEIDVHSPRGRVAYLPSVKVNATVFKEFEKIRQTSN